MTTYLVFTHEATLDAEELSVYHAQVGATLKNHPATPLAVYGAQEVLEGEGPEGIVILAFPDQAAALAWYEGPEYRKVREHRFKGGRYRTTLVEGV